MDKIVEMIKAHPVPIIGGALVLVLLMMRGSTVSGSSDVAASLQSQQIATAGNVQLSSIAAQDSMTRAGYSADMYKTAVGAATANAQNNSSAMVASLVTAMGFLTNQQSIAAQTDIQEKQISASHDVAITGLTDQLDALHSNNATQLAIAGISSDTTKYLSDQTYALNLHSMDLTAANLPTILQHSENLANITAGAQESIAASESNTAIAVANSNNKAAQTNADTNQTSSWIKDVATVASFFF